jgi:glutamate dehydrogenase/leucine dehydrogenase
MSTNNPFLSAQSQMRTAYEFLAWQYDAEFAKILYPERVIEVNIPVQMDNWEIRNFVGYRSQHNAARGPYKGGIRYHQDVTRDEVMALSTWMSIKCATLDLPLGGGKWGVIVNPKELSQNELEQLSRGWVRGLYKYIGPLDDVPAPDVNTNGTIMSWMVDEYSKLVGHWSPGTFTGKPLSIGGSLGRDTATAQGGLYVLEAYMRSTPPLVGEAGRGTPSNSPYKGENPLRWKKVVIQWAGNAGLNMIELMARTGAILIGTSDSHGGIYDANGLDIAKIVELKKNKKSLSEYTEAKHITNSELLELESDILIPAALENQITSDNADKVKARLILELANGPITPDADKVLFAKWIPVIPDILANAGGVTVSYFEQVQNNTNYYWSRAEVQEKLKLKMETALAWVLESAKTNNVMLRTGAYVVAMKRILEAMKVRGM